LRCFSAGDKHLIRHEAWRVVVVVYETPEFGYCTVVILLILIAAVVFVSLKLRVKTLKTLIRNAPMALSEFLCFNAKCSRIINEPVKAFEGIALGNLNSA
jgi:hypothetical protein